MAFFLPRLYSILHPSEPSLCPHHAKTSSLHSKTTNYPRPPLSSCPLDHPSNLHHTADSNPRFATSTSTRQNYLLGPQSLIPSSPACFSLPTAAPTLRYAPIGSAPSLQTNCSAGNAGSSSSQQVVIALNLDYRFVS